MEDSYRLKNIALQENENSHCPQYTMSTELVRLYRCKSVLSFKREINNLDCIQLLLFAN